MPKYTEEDVKKALEEVNHGVSIASAAIKYGIPRTTLSGKHHHVYPVELRKGPATVLTQEEEKHLENWIFHLSDAGFAITPDQLLDSVQHLVKELKRETPFTDGRPGRKWYEAFMRRHPEVARKLSRNLSHPRTLVTQENIRNWFNEVHDYLTKENLLDVINDPKRVFNTDETAFCLCPKGDRVLVRKSSKMVYNFVNNDDKECLTALIGGNAAGNLMPSMVVYSYQRVPEVISKFFPKTWAIGRSENGWMTSETFYEYIANIFHPWLLKNNIKLPVILFVDGHSSHGTLHLSEFCQKNQIVLIALYPNSTHLTQPMDVSCFRPLKVGWRKGVRKWRFINDGIKLQREDFAPLLEQVVSDAIKPTTLINGFRKCGLHPFTPEAINFEEMMVRSSRKESNTNAQKEVESESDIDRQLFLQWIEKSIPGELLLAFQSSLDEWTGIAEHKSLFELWHKQLHFARSTNENSTAGASKSIDGREDLQVVTHDGQQHMISNEIELTFDYRTIPTVDLEGCDYVPLGDIIIIDSAQVGQSTSAGNEFLSASDHNYNERFMDITELEDEDDFFQYDSDCSSLDDEFNGAFNDNKAEQNVKVEQQAADHSTKSSLIPPNTPVEYDSDCSSSDDEINGMKSSDTQCYDFSSDDVGGPSTPVNNTKNDNVDRNTIDSNEISLNDNKAEQNAEVKRQAPDHSTKSSYIPPNTPAAFAKVLFYPGEKHLSGKKKRTNKKQKVPSVYSSVQYSEYLREKERQKDELEKQKMQRKMEREGAKKTKEADKKEREEKRSAKKKAVAIKNAELAAKKADLAMKKAEQAARKADEAAKRTTLKDGDVHQTTKKRKVSLN